MSLFKIYIFFLVLTRNSVKTRNSEQNFLVNHKAPKIQNQESKRNQVARKSARNVTETGIPVSAASRFRQEDFGFVCSLETSWD